MSDMAFLLAVLLSLTPPPIKLALSPSVCLARCTVRARVTIEPHPLNRWLLVQIDGSMLVGETRQLDGENAPKTNEFWFKDLTEGAYVAVAIVYRAEKRSEAGRALAYFEVY